MVVMPPVDIPDTRPWVQCADRVRIPTRPLVEEEALITIRQRLAVDQVVVAAVSGVVG